MILLRNHTRKRAGSVNYGHLLMIPLRYPDEAFVDPVDATDFTQLNTQGDATSAPLAQVWISGLKRPAAMVNGSWSPCVVRFCLDPKGFTQIAENPPRNWVTFRHAMAIDFLRFQPNRGYPIG